MGTDQKHMHGADSHAKGPGSDLHGRIQEGADDWIDKGQELADDIADKVRDTAEGLDEQSDEMADTARRRIDEDRGRDQLNRQS